MAMTNAERQAKLRMRRKSAVRQDNLEEVLVRLDVWLDSKAMMNLALLTEVDSTTIREVLERLISAAAKEASETRDHEWIKAYSALDERWKKREQADLKRSATNRKKKML